MEFHEGYENRLGFRKERSQIMHNNFEDTKFLHTYGFHIFEIHGEPCGRFHTNLHKICKWNSIINFKLF